MPSQLQIIWAVKNVFTNSVNINVSMYTCMLHISQSYEEKKNTFVLAANRTLFGTFQTINNRRSLVQDVTDSRNGKCNEDVAIAVVIAI